ncbi:MAG: hypothetical protein A2033_14550 [Bacteroidetes bacterium GWA2_31_9]|nr:MAG: hypothetical protein A2033_14550 [Bacteroidetes bacterium GWA2_31_9]
MKKLIFLFIVIACYIAGYGQTLQVDWGDLQEMPKDNFNEKIIGYDKDGLYILRSSGDYVVDNSNIWLDYFSTTMKSKESSVQVLLPSVEGQMSNFLDMFYISNKLILFTTVNDASKKKTFAYAQIISKDGTLAGKPILAGEILLNSETDKFNINLSPDKTRIMVSTISTYEKYVTPYIIKVFDSNLKEIVNSGFDLPLKDRNFTVLQTMYGNSGNIYFAIKAEQVSKRKTTGVKYDYLVLVHSTTKKDFDTYTVTLEKNNPASIMFALDNDENVVVFGFVSPKSAPGFTGIYYQKINPKTAKLELNTSGLFTREMILEFSDGRNGETAAQYLNYIPKNILFLENGSAVFLSEQSYTTTRTMVDPKTKAEEVIYYYNSNDVIAASASKEGKIEWTIRIPKNQKSLNDNSYYLSYFATATRYGSKVKMLYIDSPGNLNSNLVSEIKELKRPQKGVATVLTIYSDGSTDKARMFDAVDLKFLFSPKALLETPGQFYVPALDGKAYKLGSFFFD